VRSVGAEFLGVPEVDQGNYAHDAKKIARKLEYPRKPSEFGIKLMYKLRLSCLVVLCVNYFFANNKND
jgi:hypothetical protein